MSDYAIRIHNLGKEYHIGGINQNDDDTLIHSVGRAVLAPVRRTMKLLRGQASGAAELNETFWALQGITLDIKHGDVVGIIGRNGAGKSTLLKILSRITPPTVGRVDLYGRVGSLLEVGTGFHPELTGRENIFLNGTILGMSRLEISRKFDEIVDFSGVEKFIDTPIKHYSSGMTVRLAFAVAAHLEPEILIVDEVLAVGDTEFQRKSLGKMSEVASEGRTVLFVSHNMGAVRNLCQRGVLLDSGKMHLMGTAEDVISEYLTLGTEKHGFVELNIGEEDVATLHHVGIVNDDNQFTNTLDITKDFYIEMHLTIRQPLKDSQIAATVNSVSYGIPIFATTHADDNTLEQDTTLYPGVYTFRVRVPGHYLNRGLYTVSFRVWGETAGQVRKSYASIDHALQFHVTETGSASSKYADNRRSVTIPLLEWRVTQPEPDAAR